MFNDIKQKIDKQKIMFNKFLKEYHDKDSQVGDFFRRIFTVKTYPYDSYSTSVSLYEFKTKEIKTYIDHLNLLDELKKLKKTVKLEDSYIESEESFKNFIKNKTIYFINLSELIENYHIGYDLQEPEELKNKRMKILDELSPYVYKMLKKMFGTEVYDPHKELYKYVYKKMDTYISYSSDEEWKKRYMSIPYMIYSIKQSMLKERTENIELDLPDHMREDVVNEYKRIITGDLLDEISMVDINDQNGSESWKSEINFDLMGTDNFDPSGDFNTWKLNSNNLLSAYDEVARTIFANAPYLKSDGGKLELKPLKEISQELGIDEELLFEIPFGLYFDTDGYTEFSEYRPNLGGGMPIGGPSGDAGFERHLPLKVFSKLESKFDDGSFFEDYSNGHKAFMIIKNDYMHHDRVFSVNMDGERSISGSSYYESNGTRYFLTLGQFFKTIVFPGYHIINNFFKARELENSLGDHQLSQKLSDFHFYQSDIIGSVEKYFQNVVSKYNEVKKLKENIENGLTDIESLIEEVGEFVDMTNLTFKKPMTKELMNKISIVLYEIKTITLKDILKSFFIEGNNVGITFFHIPEITKLYYKINKEKGKLSLALMTNIINNVANREDIGYVKDLKDLVELGNLSDEIFYNSIKNPVSMVGIFRNNINEETIRNARSYGGENGNIETSEMDDLQRDDRLGYLYYPFSKYMTDNNKEDTNNPFNFGLNYAPLYNQMVTQCDKIIAKITDNNYKKNKVKFFKAKFKAIVNIIEKGVLNGENTELLNFIKENTKNYMNNIYSSVPGLEDSVFGAPSRSIEPSTPGTILYPDIIERKFISMEEASERNTFSYMYTSFEAIYNKIKEFFGDIAEENIDDSKILNEYFHETLFFLFKYNGRNSALRAPVSKIANTFIIDQGFLMPSKPEDFDESIRNDYYISIGNVVKLGTLIPYYENVLRIAEKKKLLN